MNKDILRVLFKPLTLINKIKKKEDNLIFLYTNLGFRDNVRALYEYLIKNKYNEKYRIVVSIKEYKHYKNQAPHNVRFVSLITGIPYFLKAKYAFYCFGKYPIKPGRNQTVVNMWHGTPMKRIGNLEEGLEQVDYNYFTSVITNSKIHKELMAQIFSCNEENVDIMGYPRCDELFEVDNVQDEYIRGSAKKIILWLPTYREYDEEFVISTLGPEDLNQIDELLEKLESKMIVKMHPLQKVERIDRWNNIQILSEDDIKKSGITVYSILRNADGLITDYSSVYYDYMLLNRPIGFAIQDINKYESERGFLFEKPKEYMPGYNIKNVEDAKKFIQDIVAGVDKFSEERKRINRLVNKYKDGENSRRIVERYILGEEEWD